MVETQGAFERLAAGLHAMPAAFAVLRGPDLIVEMASDRFVALTSTSILGKPFRSWSTDPRIDGRLTFDILDEVYATGTAFVRAEALYTNQDHRSWVDVTISALRDSSGKVEGVSFHALNVTERVEARQALEKRSADLTESEVRLRSLFESPLLGVFYFRPKEQGRVLEANERFAQILGLDRADVDKGLDLLDITAPSPFGRSTIEAVSAQHEIEFVRKDGSTVRVLIGSARTGNEDISVGFLFDLSEQRAADQARHHAESERQVADRRRERAERLVRAAVSNAPLVLTVIDEDGIFQVFEGRQDWGLELRPHVGKHYREVYRDMPGVMERVTAVLGGATLPMTTYEHGEHVLESRMVPMRSATGEVIGAVGVAFDVTERHKAEQARARMQTQLLHAQKLESLGVLAGGIAHDFNNLLTVILGNASLALLDLPPNSPARSSLEDLGGAARRAADLTRQMLAYAGRGQFEIRAVDLSAHVREIAHLVESTLSKKVHLKLDLAKDLRAVEVDTAQIQQIVMNLVINGAEAIGETSGVVVVSTSNHEVTEDEPSPVLGSERLAPGPCVLLEVRDTGCGMDEATVARIFDPFFTSKFSGRGLGLAAVLGIVRSHRGMIQVSSTPKKGSTFRVMFPASTSPMTVANPPAASQTFTGSGAVLLVDDEDMVRSATRRVLVRFGFRVLEARNGREGVEVFRAHADEIRCVILDMTMPVMNGDEALTELRTIRPDVKVLLTSGYAEGDATRRFVGVGQESFIKKPFSVGDLSEKLARLLDIPPLVQS